MTNSFVPVNLSVKQLAQVFGVTEMTIYNWREETATKTALPKTRTAALIEKWAKRNGVAIVQLPAAVLRSTPRAKTGPKPKVAPLKRTAAGKLTSVRVDASTAGSLGTWAAKQNSVKAAKSRTARGGSMGTAAAKRNPVRKARLAAR